MDVHERWIPRVALTGAALHIAIGLADPAPATWWPPACSGRWTAASGGWLVLGLGGWAMWAVRRKAGARNAPQTTR